MKSLKTLPTASFALFLILSINFSLCQAQAHHGWHKAGSRPDDYEMKIVSDVKHNGNGSVKISALKDDIDGFGTYMQTFKADYYLGERLQLTGWIKTEDVSSAQMWMRLDGKNILLYWIFQKKRSLLLSGHSYMAVELLGLMTIL